ncbi:MAG: tetratricopeptide repeat protein [Candidatus Omnitrophota bacterium]
MKKTKLLQPGASLFKKTALVFLGILSLFVLLEVGLRLGGFILSSVQEYGNLQSIKQRGIYRILCLGESTTERQYPHLLEQVLNQQNIGVRFSVIDKGRTTANTLYLLSRVESYLAEYHPDMVVAMMGINDKGVKYYEDIPESDTWLFKHCRIYRFGRILYMHLWKTIQKKDIYGFTPKASGRKAKPRDADTVPEKLKPSSPFLISSRLFWEEKFLRAENSFKKAVEINPKNDDAYVELGRVCQDYRKDLQAENLFKKAIEINPKNDQAYVELGQLYLEQVKFPQAENLFKKAMEINPKNDDAYVGFGRIYRSQGDYLHAEDFFNKAIELNPKNDRTCVELGQLYLERGKFQQVEDFLKKAVELNPVNYRALINLGKIYREQGKFPEAEDAFKKSIELNPVNDYAYVEFGALYREEGKFPQAEDLFKKTLELDPENDRAAGALLSMYKEMGKPELAKEYAKKVKELKSEDYAAMTVNNYRKLKEILDRKRIQLVCAQYPMRPVELLKRIFENNKGIVFVDNERVFKEAVKKGSYKEYFGDIFAGDFGHCTQKGNKLLAQNIANVILKEVFKSGK